MLKIKLKYLTLAQRELIAKDAAMNADSLRHIATGRRAASAKTAIKIEKAAQKIGLEIRRESMCEGCAGCEFAKQARRAK